MWIDVWNKRNDRRVVALRTTAQVLRTDDVEPALQAPIAAEAESLVPTTLSFLYEAEGGLETERTVTIRKAWRTDGVIYVQGRCHLRGADRTFRADRITDLVCQATGEAPDDPEAWLSEHALFVGTRDRDHSQAALARAKHGLALLGVLAAADGALDDREVSVVVEYVARHVNGAINWERVASHIRRLSPDLGALGEHLLYFAARPNEWSFLKDAASELIAADEVQHISELSLWASFQAGVAAAISCSTQSVEADPGPVVFTRREWQEFSKWHGGGEDFSRLNVVIRD